MDEAKIDGTSLPVTEEEGEDSTSMENIQPPTDKENGGASVQQISLNDDKTKKDDKSNPAKAKRKNWKLQRSSMIVGSQDEDSAAILEISAPQQIYLQIQDNKDDRANMASSSLGSVSSVDGSTSTPDDYEMAEIRIPSVDRSSNRHQCSVIELDKQTLPIDNQPPKPKEYEKPFSLFWKLFKKLVFLMTPIEKCLFLVGVLSAILLGFVPPYVIYQFGNLVESFVVHVRHRDNPVIITGENNPINYTTVGATTSLPNFNSSFLNETDLETQPPLLFRSDDEPVNITYGNLHIQQSPFSLYDNLADFAVGMSILAVTSFAVSFVMLFCLDMAAESFIFRLRQQVLRNVISQDLSWYNNQDTEKLEELFAAGLDRLQEVFGENLGLMLCHLITVMSCTIEALLYGWKLALVLFTILPVHVSAAWLYSKTDLDHSRKESHEFAKAEGISTEVLRAIKTIAAFGGETMETIRYESALQYTQSVSHRKGWICSLLLGVMNFSKYLTFAIGFWYGIHLSLDARRNGINEYRSKELKIVFFSTMVAAMTAGQLIPYIYATYRVTETATLTLSLLKLFSSAERKLSKARKLMEVKGKISFDNVSFSLPSDNDNQLLKNFNLEIEAGSCIALVGPKGGGKSTVLHLLQRFYDPWDGKITLDDQNIHDLDLGWFRNQLGVVDPNAVIFSTTVKENIRYGRQEATEDEIKTAAKEANAHDFIMKLPQQYNTVIGDHGTYLTGSQKQRIAIARALLRKPSILLLDNPTVHLEPDCERTVLRALQEASLNRTTVIIPNRLSTIQDVDCIVVMVEGVIVETGNHEELMRKRGIYYQLLKKERKFQESIAPAWDLDEEELDLEVVETIPDNESENQKPVKKYRTLRREEMDMADFKLQPTLLYLITLSRLDLIYIVLGLFGATLFGFLFIVFAISLGNHLGMLSKLDPDEIGRFAVYYAWMVFGVAVAAGMFSFLQHSMFSYFGVRITNRIRVLLFRSLLRQEITWFEDPSNNIKALSAKLGSELNIVQEMVGRSAGKLVQIVSLCLSGIVVTFAFSWKMALVVAMFTSLAVYITSLQARVSSADSGLQNSALEAGKKIAIESLRNMKTVASLHAENVVCSQYKTALLRVHSLAVDIYSVRGLLYGITKCAPLLLYSAVNSLGGFLILNDRLPHYRVITIQQVTEAAFFAFCQGVHLISSSVKALEVANGIFQLIHRHPVIDSSVQSGLLLPNTEQRNLELSNVHFRYAFGKNSKILEGVSFRVEEGQLVAIVGETGGGKSTCLELIQRFYDPMLGNVLIDQIDLHHINIPFLRRQMALVSQNPLFLSRTIGENVAYGDVEKPCNIDDIVSVCQIVRLHDFIMSLPERYDTLLGDKNDPFTLMQKKQLALARALYRNPKILLIDEMTEDSDSQVLWEILKEVRENRTCLVTSKRVNQVQNADHVILLHRGHVVEQGSHTDLIARGRIYVRQISKERRSRLQWRTSSVGRTISSGSNDDKTTSSK